MARRRSPRYSSEFRAEAIRLARTSSDSLAQVARDVGVSIWTLRAWLEGTRPVPEAPITTDERTELTQLRREMRQLREERDILEKATAFFAKQSE